MKPSSKSYSRKARRARRKKFTSRGYKRAPRNPRARKGKFVYHDYVTYVTIPEHVGTRSVMISMNDIMCPEVNFNSAFVLPGSRHWIEPANAAQEREAVTGDQSITPDIDIKKLPIYSAKNENALNSVRDYKFLLRTKDCGGGTHTEIPLNLLADEGDTKEDEGNEQVISGDKITRFVNGIRAAGPRKRGTMNRLVRGNGVCQNLEVHSASGATTNLYQKYIQYGEHKPKVNNCAVLGTVCKGNYFIPRNGAAEYYLKRCVPPEIRNEKVEPSVTTFTSPGGDIRFHCMHSKTGVHDAFVELYGLTQKGNQEHLAHPSGYINENQQFVGGEFFENTILKNLFDRGIYEVGDTRFFGLSFRPCGLPSYVPHLQEVVDGMVCNTELAIYDRAQELDGSDVTPTGVGGRPSNSTAFTSFVDTKARNFNLWKNLSQRNLCEMMRVLQMTEEEMFELQRDGTAHLAEASGRIGHHGHSSFSGNLPRYNRDRYEHIQYQSTGAQDDEETTKVQATETVAYTGIAGGVLEDRTGPDADETKHGEGLGVDLKAARVKKVFEEGVLFKKCVKSAKGVHDMAKDYDHHLVIGSKIDVQLIETSMSEYIKVQSKRGSLTSQVGQVFRPNIDLHPGKMEHFSNGNELERVAGELPDVNCMWGIQKCYPEDHEDFGIPSSINQSPDTHECLPKQKEIDENQEWSAVCRNRSVSETWNQIMKHDRHSSVRKDMFKLKGHYVEACSLRGKRKLSSKYDFNSSIKRYHDFNEKGQVEYDTIPLKKDERFVTNHRIEDRYVPDGKGGYVEQTGEQILKKRAKRYDMRLKYMPCFRIFSKRASPRMHNYAFTQMKLSTEDIKLNALLRKDMVKESLQGPGVTDMYPLMRPSLSNYLEQQQMWNAQSLDIQELRRKANSNTSNEFIDGCRIAEVVPQNPFVFVKGQTKDTTYTPQEDGQYPQGESKFTSVPLQDGIYVEGGADKITPWEGTIDSDAKEMIENFRTPAMRFKVRVRYKVWWWNETNATVLKPEVDDYIKQERDCLNAGDMVIPNVISGDMNKPYMSLSTVTPDDVYGSMRKHQSRGQKRPHPTVNTTATKRVKREWDYVNKTKPADPLDQSDNRTWLEVNAERIMNFTGWVKNQTDMVRDLEGAGQEMAVNVEYLFAVAKNAWSGVKPFVEYAGAEIVKLRQLWDNLQTPMLAITNGI